MARKSRELAEQGKNIISLSIGEPDFNTADSVKDAAIKAIHENFTHYTPVSGISDLRQGIANKLKKDNGLDYSADQIVVSNGAKQSIINALMVLVNPDDEVIVPAPYWVSYPEMIKLAEGKMVVINGTIDQDFKITPEQLESVITDKTKVFLFNSPSNPSGSIYSHDELKALAAVLAKHPRVHIISDEIYEYINFDGNHTSIAEFPEVHERVILINGVSKGYAMTGWRIGYMAATKKIALACNKLQGQFTSGASSISQRAAQQAIGQMANDSREVKSMVDAFRSRRDLVLKHLNKIPGIITNIPPGAFYVFPDISSYLGKSNQTHKIKTDNDLCLYLLEKAQVALVPGAAFGNPDCIRISYATSELNLIEALKRIKDALAQLH